MFDSRRQRAADLEGRYQLLAPLGKGGMGEVHRAREVATGRLVALKVLSPEVFASPTLRARLQREAELLARVEHPGVVRVLASWVGTSGPILVMELVEGARPIDVAWDDLDLRGRVALVKDAAVALGAAHRAGVVHRDVKPGNLLVDARGKVRVLDFGLAISDDLDRLTRSGLQAGTPQWMAPEQFAGPREAIGPPTDVWALGVVLYQALSGTYPFPGPTLAELAVQVAVGRVPSIRAADRVPRALEAICRRCLASAPCDRYPDGSALGGALEDWLEGRTREPRRLWLALGGAASVLLAGGAFLALRDQPAPPSPPLPVPAPLSPVPAKPVLDEATLARGDLVLRRAQREDNPVERRALLREWLGDFAAHPRRPAVEEELKVLALTIPVARIQLPAGNPEMVAVGARWAVWAGQVQLLELRGDELVPIRRWPDPGNVRRLMAPAGQDERFYAADRGGALVRFDLASDAPARRGVMPLRDAALATRDGRDLLAVSDDRRARVFAWGAEALEPVYEGELGGDTPRALELSRDGRWLLYSHGSSGPLDGSRALEVHALDGGARYLHPMEIVAALGVAAIPDQPGFAVGDQVGGVFFLVREGETWREQSLRVPTGNTIRYLACGPRRVYAIATTQLTGILDQFDPPAVDGTRFNRTGELPGRPSRVAVSPDERFVAVLVGKPTPEDGNELLLFQVE